MATELQMRHRDFMKTFAIFKEFHPNDLLLLAIHLRERRFNKNQVIFQEGEPGDSCFFVVFGSVAVLKKLDDGKYEALAVLKSGQMFGQVSLIDGQPRSATCAAASRALLLELPKMHFDEMFATGETFAFRFQDYLSRVMVKQVRQANDKATKLVKAAKRATQHAIEALPDIPQKTGALPLPTTGSPQVDEEIKEVFHQFKDAMRSAKEMGIDLDDVDYVIPEGQQRPEISKNRNETVEAIRQVSTSKAPAPHETTEIELDALDAFVDLDSYSNKK